jgi:hypothetical protein
MEKKTKLILFLLLFFFLLRVGVVIIAGQKASDFADGVSYNGFATAILQNSDWLTNPDFIGDYRAPGYPMFVAAIYALFGMNRFLAVYIFQAIISTLTCFYIYQFAKKIFNDKVALLSLIWSGFYISYLQYVSMLLRETLVFFFIIVFFYYLYLFLTDETNKTKNFCLTVIFYSLLIHTDPRYLFYLPFFIIFFIVYQPAWQGIKRYSIFLVITLLLMAPWAIRNYIAYDGIVIINTRGIDFREKTGRNHKMAVYKSGVLNFGIINSTKNKDYPSEEERKLIKAGLNPNNRSEGELIAIRNDVYPASTYLGRKAYMAIELWKPFDFTRSYRPFPDARYNKIWSIKHNLSSIMCYGILLPFMIFGIYALIKKKDRVWYFLTLPLVVHTLLHMLEHGRNRYRIPVDFFIIILGCYGMVVIYDLIKNKGIPNNSCK